LIEQTPNLGQLLAACSLGGKRLHHELRRGPRECAVEQVFGLREALGVVQRLDLPNPGYCPALN
jgi:hypothetical protein